MPGSPSPSHHEEPETLCSISTPAPKPSWIASLHVSAVSRLTATLALWRSENSAASVRRRSADSKSKHPQLSSRKLMYKKRTPQRLAHPTLKPSKTPPLSSEPCSTYCRGIPAEGALREKKPPVKRTRHPGSPPWPRKITCMRSLCRPRWRLSNGSAND